MVEDKRDDIVLGVHEPQEDNRALPKARRDVEITEQVYYGKPCYVLKDPTSLRYYRLRPPEYSIYEMLDGKADMEEVLKNLSRRFPNEEFDSQAVMSFIIMLRGANLLHLPGEQSTDYLLQRKEVLTQSFFKKIRREYLFYRICLFDPDKFLNYLNAHLGKFIYSRFMAVLAGLIIVGALFFLIGNFEKLGQRQPILDPFNLLLMAIALFLIKIPHEFGHGLTSKHFGGEVHEMGILFLVFMPCMYCDVSDAWMIPEKKRRMYITAAGIIVEFFMAALATYVWALTEPKTVINQFSLNVMIVASLNSFLFNGNPLLRYDGYYFMMDLVEIPNLKQKSSSYLWYLLQKWVLGVDTAQEPIDVRGREFTVSGYAVCSAIYRWFIMVAIITMVWKFLDPYGWGVIGGIMALACIYSSFIQPLIKFSQFLTTQRHRIHIRIATAVILLLVIGGAIYGLLLLPVEQTVEAQCVLRPHEMHSIYVTQPGFIESKLNPDFIKDGQQVKTGQVLLVLSNPNLEYEVADLNFQIKQKTIQKDNAHELSDDALEAKIQTQIKQLQSNLERARHNLEHLTIRSPADGIVQLRMPIPLANLDGTFLPLQGEIFAVYQPGYFEAVSAVNHRDIELIDPCQAVQIKLWALSAETFETRVSEKPPTPVLKMSSAAFSTVFGGEISTMPTTSREEALEPAENTYELIVGLPQKDLRLRDGMVGKVKIIVEKKTLAEAFYLWLIRTLRQDIRL